MSTTDPTEAALSRLNELYRNLRGWAAMHLIQVQEGHFAPGKAGEFNGRLVTMNCDFSVEERAFYLIHALATIALWGADRAFAEDIFAQLEAAKKESDAEQLDTAIANYRDFESQTSGRAVWLLEGLGFADLIASYTNFMRADLESMTEFHRNGRAPQWHPFFAQWNAQVAAGSRQVPPFAPQPISVVRIVEFKTKEILQQQ